MKLFNQKGLIRGLGATILGIIWLIGDVLFFDEIGANIIWSIILIVIGLCDCGRCFSRKKADQDMIEEDDERNKLVKLTSKARSLDIVEGALLVVVILFAIIFKKTGNPVFIGVILTAGFTIIAIMILKLITNFYYDR